MTDLKKTVKRVSAGVVREAGRLRKVVVILESPNVIKFRAKGCRRSYSLTTDACYHLAIKAHVQDQKRQKTKKKKQGRRYVD